jgi:hypothetical protein
MELAVLVIGDVNGKQNTLPMQLNEVAFFGRALRDAEVGRFFGQRIPANADGLICKWELLEGSGHPKAINSAATGPAFDAEIRPEARWVNNGLYFRPQLGHGGNIAVLDDAPILHGWSHLAMVHQAATRCAWMAAPSRTQVTTPAWRPATASRSRPGCNWTKVRARWRRPCWPRARTTRSGWPTT